MKLSGAGLLFVERFFFFFCLLIQFHYWQSVCLYFLFISASVLGDCIFLGICPFLLGCPFYSHVIVVISYDSLYFCGFDVIYCLFLNGG